MLRTFSAVVLLLGMAGAADYWLCGFPERELAQVAIGGRAFYVEVADNGEERAAGLSGRDQIGSDGMLFVFDEPTSQCFWMKDTRFPLDLIFIESGRVLGIEKMEALSECMNCYCPPSGTKITHALELPEFSVDRYNIRLGDPVQIILPEELL